MSNELNCQQVQKLSAEVALGIATGQERAAVLRHVVRCADCKRDLAQLSELADELLLLAPRAEPPGGFEGRTLQSMPIRSPARRWLAAAAVVIALAVGAGGVLIATSETRELGTAYQRTLAAADGRYFGVYSITEGQREVGDVFVYSGDRAWIFLVFRDEMPAGTFTAEMTDEDGRDWSLGTFELAEDDRDWGTGVAVDLGDVQLLRVIAENSDATYEASFESH